MSPYILRRRRAIAEVMATEIDKLIKDVHRVTMTCGRCAMTFRPASDEEFKASKCGVCLAEEQHRILFDDPPIEHCRNPGCSFPLHTAAEERRGICWPCMKERS